MKTCFSGGEDLAAALRVNRATRLANDASFNEGDHPRDEGGKFAAEATATNASGIHHGEQAAAHEKEAADWNGRRMYGVAQMHRSAATAHGSASFNYHQASDHYAKGMESQAIKHHDRADETAERVEKHESDNRLGYKKAPPRRFDED
jgi:hypothetical protein